MRDTWSLKNALVAVTALLKKHSYAAPACTNTMAKAILLDTIPNTKHMDTTARLKMEASLTHKASVHLLQSE